MTLLQECHFRLPRIAGLRQHSFTQWQRRCGEFHLASNDERQSLIFNSSESFHPDIDPTETPAHVYVRSIHNIAVERSWLRLRLEFGDNAVIVFKQGEDDGVYLAHIPEHAYVDFMVVNAYLINYFRQLCQWLWPKLLRKLIREFMDSRNSYKSRLDHNKPGPSGISRNEAFSLPHLWGGRQCLLDVNMDVIQELKDIISEGEDMFRFPLVTPQFELAAENVYESLHIQDLSLGNVWSVFSSMMRLLFPST